MKLSRFLAVGVLFCIITNSKVFAQQNLENRQGLIESTIGVNTEGGLYAAIGLTLKNRYGYMGPRIAVSSLNGSVNREVGLALVEINFRKVFGVNNGPNTNLVFSLGPGATFANRGEIHPTLSLSASIIPFKTGGVGITFGTNFMWNRFSNYSVNGIGFHYLALSIIR